MSLSLHLVAFLSTLITKTYQYFFLFVLLQYASWIFQRKRTHKLLIFRKIRVTMIFIFMKIAQKIRPAWMTGVEKFRMQFQRFAKHKEMELCKIAVVALASRNLWQCFLTFSMIQANICADTSSFLYLNVGGGLFRIIKKLFFIWIQRHNYTINNTWIQFNCHLYKI